MGNPSPGHPYDCESTGIGTGWNHGRTYGLDRNRLESWQDIRLRQEQAGAMIRQTGRR